MSTHTQAGPGSTQNERAASGGPSSLNHHLRKWFRQTRSEAFRWLEKNEEILSFKELYIKESRQLGDEVDAKSVIVVTGTAGEPWVAFTPMDRFGLALSGGGIRSATFNIGLLQALASLGVLRQLNYLSTVSGGGYAGGFWTAWLRRRGQRTGEERFPLGNDRRGGERAEVRHLREFSRFLLPRVGMLETEFWGVAMTILGGLIPSLLTALAVLVIVWYFWALLLASLSIDSFWSAGAMGVSLLVYLAGAEFWWGRSRKSEHNGSETWGYSVGCGIGLALAFKGWALRKLWLPGTAADQSAALLTPSVAFAPSALLGGCTLALLVLRLLLARFYRTPTGISVLVGVERALTRFLGLTSAVAVLAALWGLAGLMPDAAHGWGVQITAGGSALSAALFAWAKKWLTSPPQETHGSSLFRTAVKSLKRATPKLLASLAWLLLFLLVGAGVQTWGVRVAGLYSWQFWTLLGASVGTVGLTAWLFDPARVGMHEFYRSRISRCYLGASNIDGKKARPEYERAANNRFTNERPGDDLTLKELPGSAFLSPHDLKGLALAHRLLEQNDPISKFLWTELSWHVRKHLSAPDQVAEPELINPPLVKELNRILRAGSIYEAQRFAQITLSQETRRLVERNIQVDADERVRLNRLLLEDAFPQEIARSQPLPLHLVCVAANDMSGDRLGTLYRGARSAVLSVNGISLGDDTAKLDDLRFSAALTASAAAFNSQMGRISIDLGPAVTFLMSALNLRLGLWVPHPNNRYRGDYLFPGRFFLYELLGRSRTNKKHLHLSDGDHFENFGLYELIRRHCRYIIVSDCGADPEVAFDDLANVLRRVREDFGVEIELDVSPLRPGEDGLARQHAVVGTIHYNSPRGMDKGTILFFKPVLTGDEPADVLQYRTRNRAFPHETTSDQFYDEAQWESYRRLGEHAGRVVLDFFEQSDDKKVNRTDRLFRDARSLWHPAPPHQLADFLSLTDRRASLEADLTTNGPSRLRHEFFFEAVDLAAAAATPSPSSGRPAPVVVADPNLDEELKALAVLMRVLQIMEDVWLAADLDHYWSHPLNQGWMNYFQRWASTPSFRRWWPILGPIYSPGFREFAKERFAVGVTDDEEQAHGGRSVARAGLELRQVKGRARFLAGNLWRQFKQRRPASTTSGRSILAYEIELQDYNGNPGRLKFQVGFVLVEEQREGDTWIATWKAEEFFVPPAMHGVGIVSRFLDAVVRHFQSAASQDPPRWFSELRVQFGMPPAGQATTDRKPGAVGLAARHERVREIEFYKSRGFQYVKQEDPKTGAIMLSLRLH